MEQTAEVNLQIAERLMPTKTEPLEKLKTDYDVSLEFLYFSSPQTKPEILRRTLFDAVSAKVAVLKEEGRLDPQGYQFNLEFQKNLQQWEGARDVVAGLRTREATTLLNVADELKRDAVGAAIELCDRDVAAAGSWAKAAAQDTLEKLEIGAEKLHRKMQKEPSLYLQALPATHFTSRVARRRYELVQAESLKWKRIERTREVDEFIRANYPAWMKGGKWERT